MDLRLVTVYAGPNTCVSVQALRARLVLGAVCAWRGGKPAGESLEPLLRALPALGGRLAPALAANPSLDIRGNGTDALSVAGVAMHGAMALQDIAGYPLRIAQLVPAGEAAAVDIVCEYRDGDLAWLALRTAASLVAGLAGDRSPGNVGPVAGTDVAAAVDRFLERTARSGLDLTTRAIAGAAEERGIPWFRLDPDHRIVQLGQGRFARRIVEDVSDREGFVGTVIAGSKAATNRLLGALGLPVTRQATAIDAAGAVRAAREIGYPVVVKPVDGSKGRGVHVGLRTDQEVNEAAARIARRSRAMVVEGFVAGADHRLLVVGGNLVAAAQRLPGGVTGDGRQTVRELVAAVNRDPRRGVGFSKTLVRLALDEMALAVLAAAGLGADSVPAEGTWVPLRRTANISTGGTAIDVTARIHPDNRRMAEQAALAVGLDVAGIDFLTTDIGCSYLEIGGAICEVNRSPGLRPHWIAEGDTRRVVVPILDRLFPPGSPARVPIAAITGTNGKTTTTHMVAHIVQSAGLVVGRASTIGVAIDGQWLQKGDLAGPTGAGMVLRNPKVEAAVLETARGGLIRRGLGFDRCDVGAVLNVTVDHLGASGVRSIEEMAAVKCIVAAAATGTAVLNADDPLCLAMAAQVGASVCLVSMQPDNEAVRRHAAGGGRGAVVEDDGTGAVLVLLDGPRRLPVLSAADIPATYGGLAVHNVQNALFAAAIAHGLGHGVEQIRAGLATFACRNDSLPARANLHDRHPFKVILDYAHNPGAFQAIGRMVDALATGGGRRIGVFTSPANRNDDHLAEIARTAAPHFDHFVCRQGVLLNRQHGEIPAKLRDALIEAGIAAERIDVIPEEEEALLAGLRLARPGDVVFIMSSIRPDNRFWPLIEAFPNLPGSL